jgi:dUTP pyrophosphatase
MKPVLRVSRVRPDDEDLPLPRYMTPGSAGLDLVAALPESLQVAPGGRTLIPTGLRIAVPEGYEAQVRPRSGLALKHGITLLNAPGTIDSDYRGEVGVILANMGTEPFEVKRGDRIAQLVVAPVVQVEIEVAKDLPETQRGDGGFGHTGA